MVEALAEQWDAIEIWIGLTQGAWVVASSHDGAGRRLLVVRRPAAGDSSRQLKPAERRVAALAQQGMSSKQIAFECGVSPAAVSRQLGAALKKLGLRNASELSRSSGNTWDEEPTSGITRRVPDHLLQPPGLQAHPSSEVADECVLTFPLVNLEALSALSPVEVEVVQLLVAGHSVPDVARVRGRSRHTIDNQVRTIYAKLGIGSRNQLVRAALG